MRARIAHLIARRLIARRSFQGGARGRNCYEGLGSPTGGCRGDVAISLQLKGTVAGKYVGSDENLGACTSLGEPLFGIFYCDDYGNDLNFV